MGRMMERMAVIGVFVIFLGLLMGSNTALGTEAPGVFFKGKNITWISGSAPGGPGDLLARTITPFLAKELGVKVRIETKLTDEAINYVYQEGTRDGLTLGIKDSASIIGGEILKAPGVLYETDKLNFVADVYPVITLFQISPKLPYKTLEALRGAKGLRVGGTSARGSWVTRGTVMLEILGLDGRVISGFKGTKDLVLNLTRGDLDILIQSDTTAARDEKEGFLINLFALGDKRSVVLPQVRTLTELGVKIPKRMEAAYRFVRSGGTSVVLPPGVPPERVEYLRKTFQALSNNRDLQKAVEKLTGDSRAFVPGQEMQAEMTEIKGDKELAATLDSLFKKYTAVR